MSSDERHELQFCADCEHITPKENEPNGGKPHRCNKYGESIYHRGMHPRIFRCKGCLDRSWFSRG